MTKPPSQVDEEPWCDKGGKISQTIPLKTLILACGFLENFIVWFPFK